MRQSGREAEQSKGGRIGSDSHSQHSDNNSSEQAHALSQLAPDLEGLEHIGTAEVGKEDVSEGTKKFWRVFQWMSTGFLWYTWLSHDVANIAVFLPRALDVPQLLAVIVFFVTGLGYIFYRQGGAIQQIVLDKQSTKYVRSATLIDLVYAFLLLYFKQLNNIPMSTTWVFVGLLCGRELALNTGLTKKGNLKSVFPIVAKDFLKLIVGLLVSVAIVLAIHYGTDPANSDAEATAPQTEEAAPEATTADTAAETAAETAPADSTVVTTDSAPAE